MNVTYLWLVLISVSIQCYSVKGWDNEELEIFDLVEEIGVGLSFYKVLGIEQVKILKLILTRIHFNFTAFFSYRVPV